MDTLLKYGTIRKTVLELALFGTLSGCSNAYVNASDLADSIKFESDYLGKTELCWDDLRKSDDKNFDKEMQGWCLRYESPNSNPRIPLEERLIVIHKQGSPWEFKEEEYSLALNGNPVESISRIFYHDGKFEEWNNHPHEDYYKVQKILEVFDQKLKSK